MSNSSSKTSSLIALILILLGVGYAAYTLLPVLLAMATNIIYLGVMAIIVFLLLFGIVRLVKNVIR